MIEVEVKLPILDAEKLKGALLAQGFSKGKRVREEDVYFNSLAHDFRKRDEALRLRCVRDLESGEEHTVLTFKGPKLDQVSMTREELETEVASMETMQAVLQHLGFDLQYPVRKIREYFTKETMSACVDDVELLGAFLELEVLVDGEEDRETALLKIEEMLKKLGYSMADTTRTSYLTMLMEREIV